MLITTGTLAKQLGVSREQILADLELLHLEPVRDSIGRRLLSVDQARRVSRLHEARARRRTRGGIQLLPPPRKSPPEGS